MSPRFSLRSLYGQSDQRLAALIRDGDERAFEALVHRYRRPLLRYCRRSMGLSEARAEDVLQHALLQCWLSLGRGSEVREVRAWLYRVVHNAAVNVIRAPAERASQPIDSAFLVSGHELADDRLALRETLANVAALPPGQRRAVVLSAVEGHSHDEVAAVLGVSSGSVRGLLYRARATLRNAAAAITPPALGSWLARAPAPFAPAADRVLELSGTGGAVGGIGLLAKTAVVAVTAATLAAGVAIDRTAAPDHRQRTAAARTSQVRSAARRRGDPAASALSGGVSALTASAALRHVLARPGRHPRQGDSAARGRGGASSSGQRSPRDGGAEPRDRRQRTETSREQMPASSDGLAAPESGSTGSTDLADSGSSGTGSGAGPPAAGETAATQPAGAPSGSGGSDPSLSSDGSEPSSSGGEITTGSTG